MLRGVVDRGTQGLVGAWDWAPDPNANCGFPGLQLELLLSQFNKKLRTWVSETKFALSQMC